MIDFAPRLTNTSLTVLGIGAWRYEQRSRRAAGTAGAPATTRRGQRRDRTLACRDAVVVARDRPGGTSPAVRARSYAARSPPPISAAARAPVPPVRARAAAR